LAKITSTFWINSEEATVIQQNRSPVAQLEQGGIAMNPNNLPSREEWTADALAARNRGEGYSRFLGRPMTKEEAQRREKIKAALFSVPDPWMRVDVAASLLYEAAETLPKEHVPEADWQDVLEQIWESHVNL
jgi:hypothetical protein